MNYNNSTHSCYINLIIGMCIIFLTNCKVTEKNEFPDARQEIHIHNHTSYIQRSIKNFEDLNYIHSLPDVRKVAYENAKPGWDSGVTIEMIEANRKVISSLKKQWITLSTFYPPYHFDGKTGENYINDYIQFQSTFHYAKYTINGLHSGGTIVGILGSADIVSELESMIENTVNAIVQYEENFDYIYWQNQWNKNIE